MTFSEVQSNVQLHDGAVQIAMRERRPMGYIGDSWSGDGKRIEINVPSSASKSKEWMFDHFIPEGETSL